MKRKFAVLLVLSLAASYAFARDASAEFKKYVSSMMPKILRAIEKCDADFFDKISTSDFTMTEMGRTANKAQSLAEMKQMGQMVKSMKGSMKLLTAKVVDGKGIATTYGKYHSVMKPDQTGKSHTMDLEIWYTETWVKSGNGWKIQKMVATKPGKMLMDGKPMDPSMMGGGG